MNGTFQEWAAKLERMDTRTLVGLALEKVQPEIPGLTVLYADVGKRFGLENLSGGGYCLDTGISEQNMIGVATGMCHEGLSPVVITYAPFVTGRVFDQIKAAVGEMGMPLGLVGSNAGLSKGDLGSLLMCVDDVALMRTIPGMTILSPADGVELIKALTAAVKARRPFYLRMTGGKTMPAIYREDYPFDLDRAVLLRKGSNVLVISSGAVMAEVLLATDRMAAEGRPVTVLNMHTIKPLDTAAIDEYMDHDVVITIEEHSTFGGLGSAVAEHLAKKPTHPKLISLGTPDRYYRADHYKELLAQAGLAAEPLYQTICKVYSQSEGR